MTKHEHDWIFRPHGGQIICRTCGLVESEYKIFPPVGAKPYPPDTPEVEFSINTSARLLVRGDNDSR